MLHKAMRVIVHPLPFLHHRSAVRTAMLPLLFGSAPCLPCVPSQFLTSLSAQPAVRITRDVELLEYADQSGANPIFNRRNRLTI